jgi:hypothetical protein
MVGSPAEPGIMQPASSSVRQEKMVIEITLFGGILFSLNWDIFKDESSEDFVPSKGWFGKMRGWLMLRRVGCI